MNKNEVFFSTTYKQKRDALSKALPNSYEKDKDGNVIEEVYYWLFDFDDSFAYVEKSIWTKDAYKLENGRISYTMDDANLTVTFSEKFEPMIVTWVTLEENQKILEDRESTEKEFERLKTFEKNTLDEKRKNEIEAIFEKFEDKLGKTEEFQKLKENYGDMEIDIIEDRCFSIAGRISTNFSKKTKSHDFVKTGFESTPENNNDDGYGGLLASEYNN